MRHIYLSVAAMATAMVGVAADKLMPVRITKATASSYDTRSSGHGCEPKGCVAENVFDDDLKSDSRWSCDMKSQSPCELTLSLDGKSLVKGLKIAFYKGNLRKRSMEVLSDNGHHITTIESNGKSSEFQEFKLPATSTKKIVLRGVKPMDNKWLSLLEVQVLKEAACPRGAKTCGDPHMEGLRGQLIDWSGADGGWYCLLRDDEDSLHVNVRVTAPLPIDFPHRQLITGLSVLSHGRSLVVEVEDPYTTATHGCPDGAWLCLADGGLRITVDGQDAPDLLEPGRDLFVTDGITMSAANMPVECRSFGAHTIWAQMYQEFLQGRRQLWTVEESFEQWVLKTESHAATDWCRKFIAERGLANVQSTHAVFKIMTPEVSVRLNVGQDHQAPGQVDWDGRALPELDFWQMDVGFEGLSESHETLSGLLGETARPVVDEYNSEIMEGPGAIRGSVEHYRVAGPLAEHFALMDGI